MCVREREPRENEIGHARVLSCMPVCTELQLQTLVIDVLMNNGSSRTSPKKCEPPPHHHHPSTHKRTLSTRALPSVYYLKRNIMYSHLFKKENLISFVNMTLVYKI